MNKIQLRHRLASSWGRKPIIWWRHRAITNQDIMVASYPRSGNTWLRFLLHELLTGKTADFSMINDIHSPCADFPHFHETPIIAPLQGRIIKTHEPFRKEYSRAIYLVRDPRDVAVSEYHYMHSRGLINEPFIEFIDQFTHGVLNGYGAWHKHVTSWINAPISDLLIIRYEDLKLSSLDTLKRLAIFLEIEMTVDQLELIITHNTSQAMRRSEEKMSIATFGFITDTTRFIRRAQANRWKECLTPTQVEQIATVMGSVMYRLGYE